jgi:hypothetical protein
MNGVERHYENALRNALSEIGPSEAMNRLLSKYGNVRTRAIYACELKLYFWWLKEKESGQSPDQLIKDNLSCIFRSDAIDVHTKRKHTNWLNEYINTYLLQRADSESKRRLASAAIREFYKRNDSDTTQLQITCLKYFKT